MPRTTTDDPTVVTDRAGFDRHQKADAAAGGPFGFMDDDDPDLEKIVRSHASATGKDPDQAWTDEHTRRHPAPAQPAAGGGTKPGRPPTNNPAGSGRPSSPSGNGRPGAAGGRPSSGGPSLGSVSVDDGAGLLLGLVAYALVHAYLVGGPAGARAWVAAKWLNRTGPAGQYASAPHPDTPPDYRPNPDSDGPAPTYPAGPWQQTAPIPGGVVR